MDGAVFDPGTRMPEFLPAGLEVVQRDSTQPSLSQILNYRLRSASGGHGTTVRKLQIQQA